MYTLSWAFFSKSKSTSQLVFLKTRRLLQKAGPHLIFRDLDLLETGLLIKRVPNHAQQFVLDPEVFLGQPALLDAGRFRKEFLQRLGVAPLTSLLSPAPIPGGICPGPCCLPLCSLAVPVGGIMTFSKPLLPPRNSTGATSRASFRLAYCLARFGYSSSSLPYCGSSFSNCWAYSPLRSP